MSLLKSIAQVPEENHLVYVPLEHQVEHLADELLVEVQGAS